MWFLDLCVVGRGVTSKLNAKMAASGCHASSLSSDSVKHLNPFPLAIPRAVRQPGHPFPFLLRTQLDSVFPSLPWSWVWPYVNGWWTIMIHHSWIPLDPVKSWMPLSDLSQTTSTWDLPHSSPFCLSDADKHSDLRSYVWRRWRHRREGNESRSLNHCLEGSHLGREALSHHSGNWYVRGESGMVDEEDVMDTITKDEMVKAVVTKVREEKPALVLSPWDYEIYLIRH